MAATVLDQINLLIKRKGVFPYDWSNSWDKFERTSLRIFILYLTSKILARQTMSLRKKIESKNY